MIWWQKQMQELILGIDGEVVYTHFVSLSRIGVVGFNFA